MSIDDNMKRRLSSFTRWWNSTRAQLGAALDSTTEDFREKPPTRPTVSARAKRYYDEADIIRVPAADEEIKASKVIGKALHEAWERGETSISLASHRGDLPSAGDMTRHKRADDHVPGPNKHAVPIDWVAEEDSPVEGGVIYDAKTDRIEKKN